MPSFLEDYKTVASRVEEFWEKYPDGTIETVSTRDETTNLGTEAEPEFVQISTFKASLFIPDSKSPSGRRLLATGYGQMTSDDKDKKSLEMAETVSIGRSLANAGFGIKNERGETVRPSREEMEGIAERKSLPTSGKKSLFKKKK